MAEEKKPSLKDRLKKTQVAGGGAAVAPPPGTSVRPPAAAPDSGGIVAPQMMGPPAGGPLPGIPGFGSDIAPPPIVQQQQAQAAAQRRAQAIADDPFGSSAASNAPQEMRIVIDEKPVDDREVGRKKTGTLIAVLVTGAVALGAGYALGNMLEAKGQERQTLQAVTAVRNEIVRLGDTIASMRTHVEHAAEQGNIQNAREGDDSAPAAATHPPLVDEALITWVNDLPQEPPLSPDVYAGRVGRMRGTIVAKITELQLRLNEVWTLLRQHQAASSGTRLVAIRAALAAGNPRNPLQADAQRAVVVFARPNPQGPHVAQLATISLAAGQQLDLSQPVPVAGLGITGNATRTMYEAGAIPDGQLATLALRLDSAHGLPAQTLQAATFPWGQYRNRISVLRERIEELAQVHQQLVDQLSGRRH